MNYDVIVVLGSQIIRKGATYGMAQHTTFKAAAAAIAVRKGLTDKLILSGGYNFHVRYSETEVFTKPDFSFEAFAKGQQMKSEAGAMYDFIVRDGGIDPKHVVREELSATTAENALFVATMLKRSTFENVHNVGVLALAYHMERALKDFQVAGVKAVPVFAEDLLAQDDPNWINTICEYYAKPKGGIQWSTDTIRQLLHAGESIGNMLPK